MLKGADSRMKKTDINSVEIARLAGVSRSTVSRVINNYSNVPAHTREKVMEVIREHNYFPNASAQMLAGKSSRTIGLFLIEPGTVASDTLTNMLIVSVIEHASSLGYFVLTHIIRDPADTVTLRRVKEIFFQRRIDGGIFIGAAIREPFLDELAAEGFTIGIVDQVQDGRQQPGRLTAEFNNALGMEQAVSYLQKLGHRNIALINGDMNRLSGPQKYEGYRDAMRNNGLTVRPEWVLPGSFSESGGYAAAQHLLQAGGPLPTALIAANDSAAFGAVRALREHGLAVPEGMSVIGFDDHPLSSRHQPALTTIRFDMGEMLQRLTSALIGEIEQGQEGADEDAVLIRSIRQDCSLVIRDSCRRI